MSILIFIASMLCFTFLYHFVFCHIDDEMSLVFTVPLSLGSTIALFYVLDKVIS